MKKYKKILIVTHQYLPHVSPRTTRWKLLVDELIANGHNVSILTGMYPDFDTNNVEIIYFGNKNNINIEKIFGKFGANFQKLIDENIYSESINLKNNLIYLDPTTNFHNKKDIPLLNQIQKRLIDNNNFDFIVSERDDSILLCEHFNQNSQFEYLRNKIIEILNHNNLKLLDVSTRKDWACISAQKTNDRT